MKTYVTFGQVHRHVINGIIFDRNCVAVINCTDARDGRKKAFEYFGDKFFTTYFEDYFNHDDLKYYPRGLIEVK